MDSSKFSIERNNSTERTVLSLKGNLTSMNAINFKKELLDVIEVDNKDCHIDISGIDSMDLTGVNALAVAHSKSKALGSEMVIISSIANPAEELLFLTKFIDVFTFQRA